MVGFDTGHIEYLFGGWTAADVDYLLSEGSDILDDAGNG